MEAITKDSAKYLAERAQTPERVAELLTIIDNATQCSIEHLDGESPDDDFIELYCDDKLIAVMWN